MSHRLAVVSDRNAIAQPVKRRERMTANDRMVIECLREQGRPMKAYDLLDCLRAGGINAPMTIYRALSRLTESGKVKKIESLNAYFAMPADEASGPTAFLLCDRCQAVSLLPVEDHALLALVPEGVELKEAAIELTTGCLDGKPAVSEGTCRKS
ncbi:transcriptional repressor [Parvularcula lutaonensis]|uniref:Transcriptional repressor n=1 Tax=Parvularcula lutaonensis TaxID=491923 RepID=A0ABV7MBB4_9PROT|nr:transcriptional repressor [Parvularcula lutaonensis]GGY38164.1 zinc uptake regulation protein [Parvularcula lutaonensis]